MEAAAAGSGFSSLSEYVRFLHSRTQHSASIEDLGVKTADQYPASTIKEFHKTPLGQIYHGNSLGSGPIDLRRAI